MKTFTSLNSIFELAEEGISYLEDNGIKTGH